MQKTKKTLLIFSVALCAVLAVTSSISANSSWKEYFTFNEMKAIKNETIDSIMSRLERDPEWKDVISGRNIKDGAITSEKLAPGAFSAINGDIELKGGIITDTTGKVSIGKSGYDSINIFGNTVIDGGLTVNRGLFAKYNITMDSASAGQQIYLTDNTNNVKIGDADDIIRLSGDTAIDGDVALFGSELSVDSDMILNGDLTLDSSESQHNLDFSGAASMVIPRGNGAPNNADCDNASEIGRLYINTASGGNMYICSNKQASIGWDTINLID